MMTWIRALTVLAAVTLAWPPGIEAQTAASGSAARQADDDPDLDPNRAQPDFTLVNLPTTLRVPRHKSAFRVTHRFSRSLGAGTFGSLAEDLFGLDSGGLIGLEYRFGLMSGLQVGLLRTSDRTIELFTHYNVLNQSDGRVLGLDVVASIDGTNNMRDSYSPALGLVASRELGRVGAVYVEPIWVNNANPLPGPLAGENDTLLVGLGARIRVRPTVYVLGEFVPRAGYTPGAHHGSFGVEKVAGGHVFQFNVSNGQANTMGQLARGGVSGADWYIGFNISRKFY
jgi:hypothetical protein